MIAGVALFLVGSVLCAMAPSVWLLVLARFLQALGGSAGQVVARASVRDRFGHQMSARVLSLLMLVLGLAPILAPIVGGYLLLVSDWRSIFVFQAAVALVVLVATIFGLKETRSHALRAEAKGESPIATFGYLLGHPRIVGYALSGAFNTGAFFAWISLSSYLLIEVYGVSVSNFGWWFGANAAGFIAMSQVNAHLMHWYTPELVLARARLASVATAARPGVRRLQRLRRHAGRHPALHHAWLRLAWRSVPNTQAAAMNVDPDAGRLDFLDHRRDDLRRWLGDLRLRRLPSRRGIAAAIGGADLRDDRRPRRPALYGLAKPGPPFTRAGGLIRRPPAATPPPCRHLGPPKPAPPSRPGREGRRTE